MKTSIHTTIKASDTPEHQTTVWPVPYNVHNLITRVVAAMDSCLGLVRRHQIWHSRRAEIGLKALCTLPFTVEASAKHPFRNSIILMFLSSPRNKFTIL